MPPTFEASTNYKFLPGDDIISKCFVAKFLEDENSYKAEIQSTDTGAVLSFDHTFKVAANIGFLQDDKKWVCQYDSVFLVFNSKGNIVSWQFTKNTGFDSEDSFRDLYQRSLIQGNSISVVYVDNSKV